MAHADTMTFEIEADPVTELLDRMPATSRTLVSWCWIISTLLGVIAISGIVYLSNSEGKPEDIILIPTIITGIAGFVMLILAACFQFNRWYCRRRLERMLNGDRLAHWSYDSKEWAGFLTYQAEVVRKAHVLTTDNLQVAGIIGLIVTAIAAFALWNEGAATLIIGSLIGFAVGFVFGLIILGIEYLGQANWYRRLCARPGVAYISKDAAFFHSNMLHWNCYGSRLESVTFQDATTDHPALLTVVISVQSKNGRVEHTLIIPVPHGEEDNARMIQQVLLS